MKEKIAELWAKKIINGERSLKEVPKGLYLEVKRAMVNLINK